MGLVLYYLYRGVSALGPDDGPSSQAISTGLARYRAESLGTLAALSHSSLSLSLSSARVGR
jgi:hypothetical protein